MTRTLSKAKRSSAATLLVEVGTEELPPRAIARLGEAFATALAKRLSEHALVADATPVWYATPRRLAVTIPAVLRRQPDQISERRGPALTKAFDAAGSPTAAAIGFAGSCGVSVGQLVQNETDKGAWLVYRTSQPGALARDLVPESIESALASLPVPKKMCCTASRSFAARSSGCSQVTPATATASCAQPRCRSHQPTVTAKA